MWFWPIDPITFKAASGCATCYARVAYIHLTVYLFVCLSALLSIYLSMQFKSIGMKDYEFMLYHYIDSQTQSLTGHLSVSSAISPLYVDRYGRSLQFAT